MPHSARWPGRSPRDHRGFTLIEVMVALVILAVMSGMAWKGVDSIMRSREIAEGSVRRTLRLQSVMKQFQADLANVIDVMVVPSLQFDGATLRMTRRSAGGVQVVAWSLRAQHLLRWAGDPVTNVGLIEAQWGQAQRLQGREAGTLTALKGVEGWVLYANRDGSWTSFQNSAGVVALNRPNRRTPPVEGAGGAGGDAGAGDPPPEGDAVKVIEREALPRGVRCVITLAPESGMTGRITRDVLVAPAVLQN